MRSTAFSLFSLFSLLPLTLVRCITPPTDPSDVHPLRQVVLFAAGSVTSIVVVCRHIEDLERRLGTEISRRVGEGSETESKRHRNCDSLIRTFSDSR